MYDILVRLPPSYPSPGHEADYNRSTIRPPLLGPPRRALSVPLLANRPRGCDLRGAALPRAKAARIPRLRALYDQHQAWLEAGRLPPQDFVRARSRCAGHRRGRRVDPRLLSLPTRRCAQLLPCSPGRNDARSWRGTGGKWPARPRHMAVDSGSLQLKPLLLEVNLLRLAV